VLLVNNMYIHKKKRDCTVAVPLLEAFALPYNSEQATPKPTPICTNTHMPSYSMYGYRYTYPEDIKMLQCDGVIIESCEVSSSQAQSALDTP
jgi:hypothetical protein